MFGQAIRLREAILLAPTKLTPIGRCYAKEWEHKSEYEIDEEEENNKNIELWQEMKEVWRNGINNKVFSEGIVMGSFNLNIKIEKKNYQYNGTINMKQEEAKRLYENAEEATFGNLETMTTDINPEVRNGRHLSNSYFEVNPKIIEKLEKKWSLEMLPREVKIIPYKINLYGKGDYFKRHRDTPDKNLVGTILVSLTSYFGNNNLIVDNKYEWIACSSGNYCCFYADVEHEVSPVIDEKIRATLAFKVYSADDEFSLENRHFEQINKLLPKIQKPFGLILSHKYSLNTNCYKGRDNILIEYLREKGYKIQRIPVCVKYYGDSMDYTHVTEINISVYPLTDEYISYILNELPDEPKLFPTEIPFIILDDGLEYLNKSQDYIEYTGNECQPEIIDSLYLHHAIIIQ